MSNHPRFRFHVQGDDIDWIKELGKVRAADGYDYEACWMHPDDARSRGIVNGDVVMIHNQRGAVLVGAVVTERIIPGAIGIEHGAKMDVMDLDGKRVDRGGCINLICPIPNEKNPAGEGEIKVPEMNVSGFLAQAVKIDPLRLRAIPAAS